jgi:hypothetical protein
MDSEGEARGVGCLGGARAGLGGGVHYAQVEPGSAGGAAGSLVVDARIARAVATRTGLALYAERLEKELLVKLK